MEKAKKQPLLGPVHHDGNFVSGDGAEPSHVLQPGLDDSEGFRLIQKRYVSAPGHVHGPDVRTKIRHALRGRRAEDVGIDPAHKG